VHVSTNYHFSTSVGSSNESSYIFLLWGNKRTLVGEIFFFIISRARNGYNTLQMTLKSYMEKLQYFILQDKTKENEYSLLKMFLTPPSSSFI
jgi:hypothetical protein